MPMPGFHRKPGGRWRAAFVKSIEFAGQLLKRRLLAQQRQQAGEVDGFAQVTAGVINDERPVKSEKYTVLICASLATLHLNSSFSMISSAARLGVIRTSFLLRACTAVSTRATVGLGSPTVDWVWRTN